MTPLQLKDSLLGFLPNLTERRTIVQQRSVRTLENMHNYASWFESNNDKVRAAFDRREHIVRLIYTDDYLKNGQESKIDHPDFNVTQRNYNLKTKEPLNSPKDDYWINNNSVTKTEYEFGQYLVAHFETLESVVNYAEQENIAIQQTLADKEARLQEVNNRRAAEEEAQKLKLQQQAFDEISKGYKELGNENTPIPDDDGVERRYILTSKHLFEVGQHLSGLRGIMKDYYPETSELSQEKLDAFVMSEFQFLGAGKGSEIKKRIAERTEIEVVDYSREISTIISPNDEHLQIALNFKLEEVGLSETPYLTPINSLEALDYYLPTLSEPNRSDGIILDVGDELDEATLYSVLKVATDQEKPVIILSHDSDVNAYIEQWSEEVQANIEELDSRTLNALSPEFQNLDTKNTNMMSRKEEFLAKAEQVLLSYNDRFPTHSQFMGELLPEYIGENEVNSVGEANEKLEQLTAKNLGVDAWTDGQQIIDEYAYNKVEDALEGWSDAAYSALVESGSYDLQLMNARREGWRVMFNAMYDVFIEPDNSRQFDIDPLKTNAAIYEKNFVKEKIEDREMDSTIIANSNISSGLENKVDFNFDNITKEIFDERTEQLVMKWEDFKTPTGETDANDAFGALVQDVWDAKYRYATLDETDKLEKWLDGYYDHFYEGGREAYEKALKTGSSEGYIINYSEKAIDQFVSLYDQHLLELEQPQGTGVKRRDELDIPQDLQVAQIIEPTNLKNNLNQFGNYKDAIYAAYPDIVGEDGFAEPNFDGLHILGKVSEPKLTQILSDSTSLSEFKLLTKQALDTTIEEENMKRDEWEKQQEQEEYDLQVNMDEVYAKATVDGDIRNLKADYIMNINNQSLLAELSGASNTDLASNVQKWNQKGGAPAVLTTYWNNLSNDHKEEFSQFVKAWKESEVESDTFNGYDTGEIDEIPNFDKIDQKKYQELDVPDERTSQYQELWVRVTESSRDPEFSLNNNFEVNNTFHELQDNFLELEQLQGTGVKRRDELDIPEEFLTMLQDGEDTRKIRVGEAFYTFSIEDQNMDQRGKQKIFLRLNNHDGGNVQEAVFQKIFGTGGRVVNHNFDSEVIRKMYDHPLIGKELHERVQRQLPASATAPSLVENMEPLGESMSKDTYETTYKNKSKNTEVAEKASASMDLAQEAMEKIKNYSQDPKEMKEYLDFMSKFPQFSPRNTALLHEQWQGANIVATYDQWRGKANDPAKNMPQVLDVKPTDIEQIKGSFTDLKTDVTKKKDMGQLSVRLGEKSQIKLLRPVTQEYILKERDGKVQPHFKKYWSKEEKEKVNSGEISPKKMTSFVPQAYFEISQTNIKPESLPKMMPNRHVNFDLNPKLAIAMQKGLEIYAQDEAKVPIEMTESGDNRLGNAKGAYYPSSEKISLNHLNTPSENVPVLIHELTHATLHKEGNTNKMSSEYANQELEAELTAYVVSKRYGLDTEKESLSYIAKWTNNAKTLSDKELSASLSHVQKTADKMTAYIDTQLDPALKLSQQQAQIKARVAERTQTTPTSTTPSFKPLGLTR